MKNQQKLITKKNNFNNKLTKAKPIKLAFTIVELVVVLTILSILWTIAFTSLQWHSKQARDTKRLSDIRNIKKSLEIFSINTWQYPSADNYFTVTYSWETVWKQWTFWDQVKTNLSDIINKKPVDPLTEEEYIFSTTYNQSEYEILAIYETNLFTSNSSLILNTNANNQTYPKIDGDYNWLYIKTPTYYIPVPSIINSEILTGTIELLENLSYLKSQITTSWNNLPWVSTWWLDINLSVYEWIITNNSTDQEKIDFVTALQDAYIWIQLNNTTYVNLLTLSTEQQMIDFVDSVLLNKIIDTNLSSAPEELSWWRALDSNCKINDITIWEQTWAWCNSTLWNWFEWWQTDINIWTTNYNWNVSSCYTYSLINNIEEGNCNAWITNMLSNTSAKNFFNLQCPDWINNYWDVEYNTIWWKLYTWNNSNSACPNWRHVPSDEELNTVITNLNWWVDCEWLYCIWLWWASHSNTEMFDDTNNLANALKLPLAGYRLEDGTSFWLRGNMTYLWSNTANNDEAYIRLLTSSDSLTHRNSINHDFGLSVRCLKD